MGRVRETRKACGAQLSELGFARPVGIRHIDGGRVVVVGCQSFQTKRALWAQPWRWAWRHDSVGNSSV